jgi:hypothetical protein
MLQLITIITPFAFLFCGPIALAERGARKVWRKCTGWKPKVYQKPPCRPITPLLGNNNNSKPGRDEENAPTGDSATQEIHRHRYTHDQSQTLFFQLPPEIIIIVYREILNLSLPL